MQPRGARTRGSWPRWLVPVVILVVSVAIAWFIKTPPPILKFVGNEPLWAKGVLAFGLFFALNMLLLPFGIPGAKIGLPLGFSYEPIPEDTQQQGTALLAELTALRQADERVFLRIGELTQVVASLSVSLEGVLGRLAELERQSARHASRIRRALQRNP